jgi:hypothetical protein
MEVQQAYINGERTAKLQDVQARATLQQARASLISASASAQNAGTNRAQFNETLLQNKRVIDALTFLGQPDNALLYPQQWQQASAIASTYKPDAVRGQVMTTPDGNQVQSIPNAVANLGQTRVEDYRSSPLVTGGFITVAPLNGRNYFAVRGDPKPYATWAEAQQAARKLYAKGRPATTKTDTARRPAALPTQTYGD